MHRFACKFDQCARIRPTRQRGIYLLDKILHANPLSGKKCGSPSLRDALMAVDEKMEDDGRGNQLGEVGINYEKLKRN